MKGMNNGGSKTAGSGRWIGRPWVARALSTLAGRRARLFCGVTALCIMLAVPPQAGMLFAAAPRAPEDRLHSEDSTAMSTAMTGQAVRGEAGIVEILSEGQFVYGPNVGSFDARGFLRRQSGSMGKYAELIQCQADYWSLNPRVLVAVIETATGLVTRQAANQAEIDTAIKLPDHPGFESAFTYLSEHLSREFYWYLYVYQSQDPAARPRLSVTFADGTETRDVPPTNAGTFAIQSILASLMTREQWDRATSREHSSSFYQTYGRLFPGDDPLDTSNPIHLNATPPSDLLKLPFAGCDTWKLYQGPHDWNGSDSSAPWSSIDFGPGSSCEDPIPTDRWITAAAAGTAYVSCNGCMVKVTHGGGWETRYYHVANTVGNGTYVNQDDHLGNPSCRPSYGATCSPCGGFASGPHHVHFAIYQNGAYQPIDGTSLEGWTVHATGWYDGYLQQGSSYVHEGGSVTSRCGGTCPQSGGVILYWNNDYNCDNGEGDPGYRQTTSTGAWNISDVFNDQASSVRVPSGWSVMLYEHENRGGGKKCFNYSDSDFANNTFDNGEGVNDKVSSFEVFDHSDCSVPVDAAQFLGQCQYPTVETGQQFSIWFEVRNTGSTTWRDSDGYGLENLNGVTLGASQRQEIGGDVPPGATKRWDIQMTAPTTPGTYTTDWMLKHWGQEFGPYMFIVVTVQTTGPVITVDDVWSTDENDQDKTSFDAGDPIKLKMTINNRGSSATTARVTWDITDPSGNPYPDLSWDGDLDLEPGVWFWSLGKTIPSDAPTGTYHFTGRVDNDGEVSSKSTTFYVQGGVDAAEFVGQCQYPTVQPGQQFSIWFEVRNTGDTTWRDSEGYGLENQNGITLGASSHQSMGSDVPPGATRRWDIQMTAPTSQGTYTTAWMLEHSGQTFGPYMFIEVTVQQTGPTITVDDVWSTDQSDQDKTSFNAGDPIKLKMTINNRGSSTTTARVTWDITDPSDNPYPDLSWDGDLDLEPGVWFWSLGKTIPSDAPTGTYHFTGRVDNNGEISSKSTTFYVQGVDVGPLVYDNHIVDDDNTDQSSGNVDGVVNCGETIELYVRLRNQGPDAATGVVATISTSDPHASWLYNTDSTYTDIPAGGTGTNANDFDFYVDPDTPDGHLIHFDLHITASNGGPWSDSFNIPVVCSVQCNDPYEPNDTPGEAMPVSYGTLQSDPDICPAGDVDFYSFIGSAGDIIVADIDAGILGSYLDAYLYLLNTDGVTVLAQNDDYDGLDSRVVYALPAAGTYYLMVRDYSHPNEGGPNYFYTISLGGYTHRILMPLITRDYIASAGSEALSARTTTTAHTRTPTPTLRPTPTLVPSPTLTATVPITPTASATPTGSASPTPTETEPTEPESSSPTADQSPAATTPTPTELPTPSPAKEEEPPP